MWLILHVERSIHAGSSPWYKYRTYNQLTEYLSKLVGTVAFMVISSFSLAFTTSSMTTQSKALLKKIPVVSKVMKIYKILPNPQWKTMRRR